MELSEGNERNPLNGGQTDRPALAWRRRSPLEPADGKEEYVAWVLALWPRAIMSPRADLMEDARGLEINPERRG
ncbi:MAG: hypothetical protein NTV94_12800, partial [Planctomycetota bacterium]|nr:hypothetical protein [Planctomycetota bacterium]